MAIVRLDTASEPRSDEKLCAHGQAALLLVESMLHALVDAGTFTTEEAVAIIAVAQDVKEEAGQSPRDASNTVAESQHLLGQIATSFSTDLQPSGPGPAITEQFRAGTK